jgi:hypothetical protein
MLQRRLSMSASQSSNTRVLATVYVRLLDEGTEVWRPVSAWRVKRNVFELDDANEAVLEETWEFKNGERVICEMRRLSKNDENGSGLVAIEKLRKP